MILQRLKDKIPSIVYVYIDLIHSPPNLAKNERIETLKAVCRNVTCSALFPNCAVDIGLSHGVWVWWDSDGCEGSLVLRTELM